MLSLERDLVMTCSERDGLASLLSDTCALEILGSLLEISAAGTADDCE